MKKLLILFLIMLSLTSCKEETVNIAVSYVDKYDEGNIVYESNLSSTFVANIRDNLSVAILVEKNDSYGYFITYTEERILTTNITLQNDKYSLTGRLVSIDSANNLGVIRASLNDDISPVTSSEELEKGMPIYSVYPNLVDTSQLLISRGYVSRKEEYYFDTDTVFNKNILGAPVFSYKGELLGINVNNYTSVESINKMGKVINTKYLLKSYSDMSLSPLFARPKFIFDVQMILPDTLEYKDDINPDRAIYVLTVNNIFGYSNGIRNGDYLIAVNGVENFTMPYLEAKLNFASYNDSLTFKVKRKNLSGNYDILDINIL